MKKNREIYYKKMRDVSENNSWTEWYVFFLECIINQSEENLGKAKGIFALYDKMKKEIPSLISSQYVIQMIDWIFTNPIFSSTTFIKKSNIPTPTAKRFLPLLTSKNILKIIKPGRGRIPTVYCFAELINLVEGYTFV